MVVTASDQPPNTCVFLTETFKAHFSCIYLPKLRFARFLSQSSHVKATRMSHFVEKLRYAGLNAVGTTVTVVVGTSTQEKNTIIVLRDISIFAAEMSISRENPLPDRTTSTPSRG